MALWSRFQRGAGSMRSSPSRYGSRENLRERAWTNRAGKKVSAAFVDFDGSKVILSGKVVRPTLKTGAERVVRQIEGVTEVVNNIDVLSVSGQDDDIRRMTYRAIYGHPALDQYSLRAVPPIHIIVDKGNVTLEGVVNKKLDKQLAYTQANSVPGVFSVTNNLRLDKDTE